MADPNNPLRYSELVIPDSSITDLISQLQRLDSEYTKAIKDIRTEAAQLAQQLSKLSGATQAGGDAIMENAAQAEALNRQYKALKTEYDSVVAALAELRKQVTAETAAQRQQNAEMQNTAARLSAVQLEARNYQQAINSLTKGAKDFSSLTKEEQQQLAQLQTELKGAKTELQQLNRELGNQTKETNAADGSINQMRAQLRMLTTAYDNMGATVRNGVAGQTTLQFIQKLNAELMELEATTGRHQRNVGNYLSAFGMLGLSVQQVARELPSLAVNANTFFLAISNNLPMLADQIKIASDNYKELIKAQQNGQRMNERAVPVWRQLISTLLSWQTALVAGVTILSLYGKEIIAWIADLFSAKKQIDANTKAINSYARAVAEAQREAVKEQTTARILYTITQDHTRSLEERTAAVDELQKRYPAYFKNLSDEAILAGEASEAYKQLTNDILESAKARSIEKQIQQIADERLKLEQANTADTAWTDRNRERALRAEENIRQGSLWTLITESDKDTAREYLRRMRAMEAQEKRLEELDIIEADLMKRLDAIDLTNDSIVNGGRSSRGGGRGSQPIDLTERINEQSLEAQRNYEEARTAIMEDGIEKRRTEAMDAYNKEIDTLRKQLDDARKLLEANATAENGVFSMADSNGRMKQYVQLTAEQVAQVEQMQDDLGNTLVEKQTAFNDTLQQLDAEHQIELLSILKDGIDQRLKVVQRGSDEELQLLLERNEKERQIALAQNRLKPSGERQDEGLINAQFDSSAGLIQQDFYMERFDQEQKLAESEFALLQTTEEEKTRFRLQAERDRYQKILDLNSQYGKQLTDTEIQTYENLIKKLNQEINASKNGIKQFDSIFDLLGFSIKDKDGNDITKEVTDAINTVVDVAKDALDTWMEARLQAAEENVRLADQDVEEARSNLEYERQLRLEGYANNVETAEKELQMKKRNQQKALQQQRKIQAQQVALDSVMQASSMIVASANIWKTFSALPFGTGIPLAIAAIATMWGSFLASRVKAMQLAKDPTGSGTESYGEGTVELLQGGSHQSGHDIDLGRKPDGTRRRAEGGEFFAVINKRNSRRYRNVIPDVIRSLNDGTFANKYMHAYDSPLLAMPAASSAADLSRLEKDVKEIRNQNMRRYYVDGKGNTVMKYKNLTRIIRR